MTATARLLTPLCALILLLLFSGAASPPQAALSRGDENKLRDLFRSALEEDGGKASKKLVALGGRLEKKVRHADLMEALARGPRLPKGEPKPRGKGKQKEQFATYGSVQAGFRFETDGETYAYMVHVPEGYDPTVPAPVLVDPGHGAFSDKTDEEKAGLLGYWVNQARFAGFEDWLIVRTSIIEEVGAGGRRGALPEDRASRAFQGLFRDLSSRYCVDPNRLYVSGLSQTGYWAWYLGRARADRLAGIAPMGAVTWQVGRYLDNFLALPTYVIHGDADTTCPIAQPRATCAELSKAGAPVHYEEVAGGKHDFTTWGKLNVGLKWLWDMGPRNPYPQRVQKSVCTEEDPWCYWLRIGRLTRKGGGAGKDAPTAKIRGELDGQTIRITSEGVRDATLCLSSAMLDLDQPVVVEWNGKQAWEGTPERDFARTLAVAAEKADWGGTYEAFLDLKAKK